MNIYNYFRECVEGQIAVLMINHGPDGHCDGYEEITDYVMRLLGKVLGVVIMISLLIIMVLIFLIK